MVCTTLWPLLTRSRSAPAARVRMVSPAGIHFSTKVLPASDDERVARVGRVLGVEAEGAAALRPPAAKTAAALQRSATRGRARSPEP